jgi:hypothetical protein
VIARPAIFPALHSTDYDVVDFVTVGLPKGYLALSLAKRLIIGFLAASAILISLATVRLDSSLHERAPRTPQPETGRVHEKVVHHGALVYVFQTELIFMDLIAPIAFFSLFGSAMYLRYRWSRKSNGSSDLN